MSNTEHYKFEAALKEHVRTMDAEKLHAGLEEFIAIATVDTVRLLGSVLGVRPPR